VLFHGSFLKAEESRREEELEEAGGGGHGGAARPPAHLVAQCDATAAKDRFLPGRRRATQGRRSSGERHYYKEPFLCRL
jgi:hypothetical protein